MDSNFSLHPYFELGLLSISKKFMRDNAVLSCTTLIKL